MVENVFTNYLLVAFFAGAFLAGEALAVAFLDAVFLAGVALAAAFLGVALTAAFLAGAFLTGEALAFLAGEASTGLPRVALLDGVLVLGVASSTTLGFVVFLTGVAFFTGVVAFPLVEVFFTGVAF
jgi:hypothetical protein